MAAATSILDEFDEKLPQCSVCFEDYKNPRQLPCSHRYCRECLIQLITDSGSARSLKCPICLRKVKLPLLGVDAFAVDEDELGAVETVGEGVAGRSADGGGLGSASPACPHCSDGPCENCSAGSVGTMLLERRMAAKPLKDNIFITEEEEICIDFEGVSTRGWYIRGIACTRSGTIVVVGSAGGKKAHITVTNWGGEHVYQEVFRSAPSGWTSTSFYCVRFQHSKIATVLDPDEIGLFDVENFKYHKKRLKEEVKVWPTGRGLRCITVDDARDQLIVGCYKGRDLYVLDERLCLRGTIRIPSVIKWPFDLCYTNESVLICDRDGLRACAINMEGDLLFEFAKPDAFKCQEPASVCTDKNGLIYILWKETWFKQAQDCIIGQYSRDGRQLLAKRALHSDAGWMTTADFVSTTIGTMEKLLVSTWASGRMHLYGLYDEDDAK